MIRSYCRRLPQRRLILSIRTFHAAQRTRAPFALLYPDLTLENLTAEGANLPERVRWGILGTGRMAATIASELATMRDEGHELVAVASRQLSKAARVRSAASNTACAGTIRRDHARPRSGRNLRRDASQPACREHARLPRRRQSRAVREAVHPQRRAGVGSDRGSTAQAPVRHGGDVDALPAGDRRAARAARRGRDRTACV